MANKNKKIVIGFSGGVDSSVAAFLLKKNGWEPLAVFLELPYWDKKKEKVRNKKAINKAKSICRKLGIPFYSIGAKNDFRKSVVNYFLSSLKNNQTPNPCVVCNRQLKLKKLFDWADRRGIKYVATGHYARIIKDKKTGEKVLAMAKDRGKDQTYYLSLLPKKWLNRIIFPLGDYNKSEVYRIAKDIGLPFKKSNQSQDFCYVPKDSIGNFLKKKIKGKEGLIEDEKGNKLGKHKGLYFYTFGQRKGISLSGGPYFVKGINREENSLIVTKNNKELFKKEILLHNLHFIDNNFIGRKRIRVMAKIRYKQPLSEAALIIFSKRKGKLIFKEPQRAATPGQFAVFYSGEICLGNGVIG